MILKKYYTQLFCDRLFFLSVLTIWLLVMTACSRDVEEDLFGNISCNTETVSYLEDVLPILESNCMICHSSSVAEAGIILEGYANLKFWVDNGRVQGSIKQESGFIPMPPLGMELNNCEIEKIISWIDQGALEN